MSKLDGIKAGDRVRVTFEGVFTRPNDLAALSIAMDSTVTPNSSWWASQEEIDSDTFQITRIEPPFKVGDEVLVLGRHRNSNETVVGFLKDGRAIVQYQAGDTSNVCAYDISCLTHA